MKKECWVVRDPLPNCGCRLPLLGIEVASCGSGQYLYDQGQARQAVSGLFSRWS